MVLPPAFWTHRGRFANNLKQQHQEANPPQTRSQTQPQPQGNAVRPRIGGIPEEGTAGITHFGLLRHVTAATLPGQIEDFKKGTGVENPFMLIMSPEAGREMEEILAHAPDAAQAHERMANSLSTMQQVDINPGRVSGRSDGSAPIQSQGQAGHGLLPGARVSQPDRAGAGLVGNNHRVQKLGTSWGQGRQPRQMVMRDETGGRETNRQEEEDTDEFVNDTGSFAVPGQQSVRRRRRVQSSLTGERFEPDNHGAQANQPGAAGGQPIGNGTFGGDRRQRDRSVHWQDPEYEVRPGQVVGLNLSYQDLTSLIDHFVRKHPKGTLYNVELIPVSPEDSVGTSPVIKGLD